MGKSSSSLKKKRSTNSSHQARKQKRNKSRSRSRRVKSKKLKRRSDSISYPDDVNSRSLVSVSSSSSEDDYRSRKSRSRNRKDVKGNKKKAQRISYSSESSPPVKKRKGSKRNDDDTEVRKKSLKKKKPRRDASISSESSRSRSCSTCPGGSDSSYESAFERHRDRSERKGKGKMEKVRSGTRLVGSSSSDESEFERPRRSEKRDRDRRSSEKVKSRIKRGRYRSRSSSLLKGYSENSGYQSEEQLMGEHNTRRLRSVIIVTKEVIEERNFDMDEHKEEILYDHDDYPSCRSNDSNDGGNKRESSHQSHFAFEKKGLVVNEKEGVVSYTGTAELIESGKDGGGQYDGSDPRLNGVGMSDPVNENKSEVSGAVGSWNGDDLESILRKTALENLNRFRGGRKTDAKACVNLKDKVETDLKQPSSAETDSVQIKPSKRDSASVLGATPVVDKISKPLVRRDSTRTFRNVWKLSDGNSSGNASRDAKQDVTCQPDKVAIAGNPKENTNAIVDPVTNKSKFATTALTLKLSPKQAPALQEPHQAKLVTRSGVDTSAAETAQPAIQHSSNNGDELNNACASTAPEPSSLLKSTSGEISSNRKEDNMESSQLEEKTMSVMRGGELVQVSYKVYIPKKTPALARRKIQR